jgi:hypothetical protein
VYIDRFRIISENEKLIKMNFIFVFQIQCLDHQNKKQVHGRRNMNIHHRMMKENHREIIRILNIQVSGNSNIKKKIVSFE